MPVLRSVSAPERTSATKARHLQLTLQMRTEYLQRLILSLQSNVWLRIASPAARPLSKPLQPRKKRVKESILHI